jgi:hypothetical protein
MSDRFILLWDINSLAPESTQTVSELAKRFCLVLAHHGFASKDMPGMVQVWGSELVRAETMLQLHGPRRNQQVDKGVVAEHLRQLRRIAGKAEALQRSLIYLKNAAIARREADEGLLFELVDKLREADWSQPDASIREVERIRRAVDEVLDAYRSRSRTRLRRESLPRIQAVRSLTWIWFKAFRELPVTEAGKPKSSFCRLVVDWEAAAEREPEPQPRSIELYLRNIVRDFPV